MAREKRNMVQIYSLLHTHVWPHNIYTHTHYYTYIHTYKHTYIHTYIWVAAGTRGWRTPLAHSHGHLCASPMRQTTFRSISLVRTPYAPRHVSSRPPSLLPSSLPSHPSDRPPFNFRYAPDMRQSTVGTTSARRRRGHNIDSQVDQKIVRKKHFL